MCVLVSVAVLFLVGSSGGAGAGAWGGGSSPPPALTQPSQRAPVSGGSAAAVSLSVCVCVRGFLREGRPAVTSTVRPAAPRPVSSHGYHQNNNNNMDGLSSDFTSASPFIAPARVSWSPNLSRCLHKKHTHTPVHVRPHASMHNTRTPIYRTRTSPPPPLSQHPPSAFSVYLRGKERGGLT